MPYTEHFETMSHDTDSKDILRPSVVLRYMQETANHQMRDQKPSYLDLFNEGKAFILSRITVKTYRKISQYEKIEVQSWPCPDKGASSTRCYIMLIDNEIVARAMGLWALVDINTKKLLRISEIDMSNYTFGEPFKIDGLRFRLPEDEMKDVGTHTVAYGEIDCNHHMNNTNYPDMLFGFIPDIETMYVSDYSITYHSEAPCGCVLRIQRSEPHRNEDSTITYFFRTYANDKVNIEAYMTVTPV